MPVFLPDPVMRFEAAWQSGPPPLADYLPARLLGSPELQELAFHLVQIDLHQRWRLSSGNKTAADPLASLNGFPAPPTLDDYFQRFPQLKALGVVPAAWIAEEYRIRHWVGDRPAWDAILSRYPQ